MGLHTGEVETIEGKVGGIAVNIGARIAARSGPGEALVSQTVKDLVAGSGLVFADAGEHELKRHARPLALAQRGGVNGSDGAARAHGYDP